MRLAVYYRVYAGNNLKSRPDWYDRRVCLRSLQETLAQSGVVVRFTFVSDGPFPDDLAPLVRPEDRTVHITGGSSAKALRRCYDVARSAARYDAADTLYWFAEDDYLYRPEAMRQLVAAAQTLPTTDYLALYVPDDSEWHATHPSQPYRAVPEVEQLRADVEGVPWHRTRQTTCTYGVRRGTLLADAWLLKLGSMAGGMWDAATWATVQRVEPYPWRYVLRDPAGYWSVRGVGKVVAKPAMRVLLNLIARFVPRPRRSLVAPEGNLAMHLETELVPAGAGWESLGRSA